VSSNDHLIAVGSTNTMQPTISTMPVVTMDLILLPQQ
jgi:hypothetical protein